MPAPGWAVTMRAMTTIAVVAPLKYGAQAEARELIAAGPPFDPERTPLVRHEVFLTGDEAVFVFEGPDARRAVEQLIGEASVWKAAVAWRRLLGGRPRIAERAFLWERDQRLAATA
jgi:hypothetical protein